MSCIRLRQHNFKYGIQRFMRKIGRHDPVKNLFFAGLARSLGGVPLTAMERFARRLDQSRKSNREDKSKLLVNGLPRTLPSMS